MVHLNGLRAIEAVLRLGSLRAAAAEMGVTAGAVSQQVIKAEAQLGVRLFERRSSGLSATAVGQEIADRLHAGFVELDRAVSLTRPRIENQVSISVPPVFAAKWLVWRLQGFSGRHPRLRVVIDASSSFADVDSFGIDACIRVGRGDWPGVRLTNLADVKVFPVCAPEVAIAVTHPADLANVPVISDRYSMFDWQAWLGPNGLDNSVLSDGPVYSDASLCLDAAIAGQGIFLAWETLASHALASGRLVAPLPGRFRTGVGYWFLESEHRPRSRPVQLFLEWLLDEMTTSRSS